MKKLFISIILFIPVLSLNAQSLEDLSFGTDSTFEALTWNIEHFPKNNQTTVDYVRQVIENLDVDVLALQEISDTVQFNEMLDELPEYTGYLKSSYFAGLAYIYKHDEVDINRIYEIYTSSAYWSEFPRSPMVMELSFKGEDYVLMNNHFKCCGDGTLDQDDYGDEENRRYRASNYLKDYIDDHFAEENVIVLGDLNDELTDATENNVFQEILADSENYKFADMQIAESDDSWWSYPGWPSHLDHILVTNELFDELEQDLSEVATIRIDQYMSGEYSAYDGNISDHRPVAIRLAKGTPTSISGIEYSTVHLNAYPNPFTASTTLTIEDVKAQASVEIFNIQGEKVDVLKVMPNEKKVHWDARDLTEGIYVTRLVINGKVLDISKLKKVR